MFCGSFEIDSSVVVHDVLDAAYKYELKHGVSAVVLSSILSFRYNELHGGVFPVLRKSKKESFTGIADEGTSKRRYQGVSQ